VNFSPAVAEIAPPHADDAQKFRPPQRLRAAVHRNREIAYLRYNELALSPPFPGGISMRSKLALASALGFLLTFSVLAQNPGAPAALFAKDPGSCLSTQTHSPAGQKDYIFRPTQTCTEDYQCFCPAETTCTCVNNVCQVGSGGGTGGGLSEIDCNGNVTYCNQTSECGYCPTAGSCINNICRF
jgi:hypothetical protein